MGFGAYANVEKSQYYERYSEFYDFISDPSVAVIAGAALIIFVSFFGMLGSLRDNIKLLYVVGTLSNFCVNSQLHCILLVCADFIFYLVFIFCGLHIYIPNDSRSSWIYFLDRGTVSLYS